MLSLLFSPLEIGRIRLKNRIVMPPVVTRLSIEKQIDFFKARAQGGVGLIQLPPGHVDSAADEGDTLPLCNDEAVPHLARLVEAIHSAGAKVSVMLFHAGGQLRSTIAGTLVVAPSPIPWSKRAEVPRELSIEEIKELVEKFVQAAVRAKKAGCDFVELSASHGFLISEFLSPLSNKRVDKYGGDFRGRAQFPVEIIRRIKEELGNDFPVSCRINGADNVPDGLTLEDAKATAPILVDAGVDLISVSSGVYGSYPISIPTFDAPPGCFVPLAEGIKSTVNVPVITAGRINDPHLAEEILEKGKADLVGMARALIADPELPAKAADGKFEEIRKCIACNACNQPHIPIRCTVNALAGREAELEIIPTTVKKRVMVIGGGPAGLEAARVAALRGHQVNLYEKEKRLGGQWLLAAIPPHKQEFTELVNYQSRQLAKLGVIVELGKTVSAQMVQKGKPEVVIVATGAVPLEISVPGLECGTVINSWDILRGTRKAGTKVLVVGGGSVGLETAHFLAVQGKQVTVIEMLAHVGTDMVPEIRWQLLNQLNRHGVTISRSTKLKQVNEQGIIVLKNDSEELWSGFDTIVLAIGTQPLNEITSILKGIVKELYVIGDAVQPRKAIDAIREGAETGCRI